MVWFTPKDNFVTENSTDYFHRSGMIKLTDIVLKAYQASTYSSKGQVIDLTDESAISCHTTQLFVRWVELSVKYFSSGERSRGVYTTRSSIDFVVPSSELSLTGRLHTNKTILLHANLLAFLWWLSFE